MQPHRLPAPGAVLRLVPGARREAGDAQVRPGHVLRRPQRPHAREVEPGPGAIERVFVDDEHVRDPLACQAERRRETALPRADDQDVQNIDDVPTRRPQRHPGPARVVEQLQLLAHARGVSVERVARGHGRYPVRYFELGNFPCTPLT